MFPIKTRDGHVAGYLDGAKFRKTVDGSRHKLQKPPGWAIDKKVFDELPRYGIACIQILDRETNMLYEAPYKTFKENCVEISRGDGKQVALADPFWRQRDGTELRNQLNRGSVA